MPQPTTTGVDFDREAIFSQLGIPSHLGDCTDHGVIIAYQKYKAQLQASQTYERMLVDGSWVGAKLSAVDIIQLFVSKSFWHYHYKRLFPRVSSHPLLVEWLENAPDGPSNLELWGFERPSYNFKDLEAYLDRKRDKGKGKKVVKEDAAEGSKKKDKKSGGSRKQVQ